MNDAANDAVLFHLSELLDEHLLRNSRNGSLKLRKPQHGSPEEMKQDYQLPAALENSEGAFHTFGPVSRRLKDILTF